MKKTFHAFVMGAAMAIGVGAIATSPAQAGSLTNATIGGTANTDYLVYTVKGTKTEKVLNPTSTDIQKALDGNAASPTGNVELRASTEQATFTASEFAKNTTLSGTIGGETLTLSSLVDSDWSSAYGTSTFGQQWFSQALAANNVALTSSQTTQLFNIFKNYGGFQRFSDPNISYVNQNDTTGKISIGLAGHLNATPLLLKSIDSYLADPLVPASAKLAVGLLKTSLASKTIQASEIVKYTYEGKTDYLFSFSATASSLTELSDGISHSGNYEVYIDGTPPLRTSQSVPEPSIVLGILGVAGIFTTQRKLKKVSH